MTNSETPSVLVRFLDAFLQERNIKWVLGVGMLILLGSSVLLVTTHWEMCTPAWKHLFLLGYAASIHGCGQWCYHRLGLRRTGTVLQGLMVVLIPLLFAALQWVPREAVSECAVYITLITATLAFSTWTSTRIFSHFLRGAQPTFLCSYILLSLAAGIAPTVADEWMAASGFVLWGVFAVGTVKVSRHVFWLAEEQRAPRIFGFFPITVLGAQFLFVYVIHVAPHVTLEWLGFGLVLCAIPVLLTADAVAGVFQQRTGDLVRPLPWSIVLPLGMGLALCVAGVVLAGTNVLPPGRPYALAPAAALAAGLMAVVARRTGKQAFVWAMLLAITLAYNFSHVFFKELVETLKANGAQVLREERLPFAFYGLSNVPLLLALIAGAAWANRGGNGLFARPLRRHGFGLSCLLLAVSLTHAKAMLPVGLVMVLLFAIQAHVWNKWYAVIPGVIAWLIAAAGATAFTVQVLDIALPAGAPLTCLALAAAMLLWAGSAIDRSVQARLPTRIEPFGISICQSTSLGVSLALGIAWIVSPASGLFVGIIIGVLLFIHALRWLHPGLAGLAIAYAYVVVLVQMIQGAMSHSVMVSVATAILGGQWLVSYVLARLQRTRVSTAFRLANDMICVALLTLLLIVIYLPLTAFELATPFMPMPIGFAVVHPVAWPYRLLILVWAFDMARRTASGMFTTLAYLGLLGLGGVMFAGIAGLAHWDWVPAVWAALALATLPICEILYRRLSRLRAEQADADRVDRINALEKPLTGITFLVFALIAAGSVLTFPLSMRVAGGLGLLGLIWFSLLRRHTYMRVPALMLANWQLLALVVLEFAPNLQTIFQLTATSALPVCLPLAFFAAASLLVWQILAKTPPVDLEFIQRLTLRGVTAAALYHSLNVPSLTGASILFAAGAFILAALAELKGACRKNREEQVWLAQLVALCGVAYLASFRIVSFGRGTSMFVVLGVGLILWIVKEWAARRPHLTALVRPFGVTAFLMPMAAVCIGVYRHVALQPVWLGANSLALLLAAGFYFWRGIERGEKNLLILAGIILNVALCLLWRELAWTDPQFFMIPIGISMLALVEILREEIPERFRDHLRYLGALVILVSPTFHIVGGSWIHLFTLMVASVCVGLLAIGMRVRALLYTGTAFLLADLVAMVVRGSIDNPNVLWIAGVLLGAAVLALGAFCERHRETLLQRMRLLTEALKAWN